MIFPRIRLVNLVLLLVALGGFAVLAPGFTGPFILDDFVNLSNNPNFHPSAWTWDAIRQAILTNTSGPLGRPVSMATFVANAVTTGLDPAPMKILNAVLHGVTALLLGKLVLGLFSAAPMGLDRRQQVMAALLATACWALHPIAVTSTLYVVQRMNLLATLFTFAALLAYLAARPWFFRSLPRAAAWMLLALALWVLGVLSKETALLAPLYVLLIEWLVFDFRDAEGVQRLAWRRFVLGSAALAGVVVVVLIANRWNGFTGGSDIRGFTWVERLLTEARVIWHYVGMILLPGHSRLGLFQDDIVLSTGLLQPWTTLASVIGIGAWIATAVAVRRRAPLVGFGLLFFLAGHLLESTFILLEIAFEHRNYLPSAGLMIALAACVMLFAKRAATSLLEWLPLGAFALFLAFFTVIRSLHWADMYQLAQLEAFYHPQSARAQTQLGFVYTQFAHRAQEGSGWPAFYMAAATEYFRKAIEIDPNVRTPFFLWMVNARAFDQPFPEEAYVELLDRLRYGAPTMSTPGRLGDVNDCILDNCGVSPLRQETMLRLALENPRLRGRIRSETLVEAARFFRFVRKDPASARILLEQAVAESPHNPRFRFFLAQELATSGESVAAREVIHEIRTLDKWGVFENEISELLNYIEKSNGSPGEARSDAAIVIDHSSREE